MAGSSHLTGTLSHALGGTRHRLMRVPPVICDNRGGTSQGAIERVGEHNGSFHKLHRFFPSVEIPHDSNSRRAREADSSAHHGLVLRSRVADLVATPPPTMSNLPQPHCLAPAFGGGAAPPPLSSAAGGGQPVRDRKIASAEQLVLDLCEPDLRENALGELSKVSRSRVLFFRVAFFDLDVPGRVLEILITVNC